MPGLIDAHAHLVGSLEPRSLCLTQYESDARLVVPPGKLGYNRPYLFAETI